MKTISFAQWTTASTEQRQRWLEDGTLLADEDLHLLQALIRGQPNPERASRRQIDFAIASIAAGNRIIAQLKNSNRDDMKTTTTEAGAPRVTRFKVTDATGE